MYIYIDILEPYNIMTHILFYKKLQTILILFIETQNKNSTLKEGICPVQIPLTQPKYK